MRGTAGRGDCGACLRAWYMRQAEAILAAARCLRSWCASWRVFMPLKAAWMRSTAARFCLNSRLAAMPLKAAWMTVALDVRRRPLAPCAGRTSSVRLCKFDLV